MPELFLTADEIYQLYGVVLLDPKHLASVMKILMKLNSKQQKCPPGVKRGTLVEVIESGRASESFLRACWATLLSEGNFEVFSQLCLFLQAFCLIIPANLVNMDVGNDHHQVDCTTPTRKVPDEEQEYLIPSMLNDSSLKRPRVFESPKCHRFYFDFKGYLPIEVFHRFVFHFLLMQRKNPAAGHVEKLYHKHCQLTDSAGTAWWLEVLEEEQRLMVVVRYVLYTCMYSFMELVLHLVVDGNCINIIDHKMNTTAFLKIFLTSIYSFRQADKDSIKAVKTTHYLLSSMCERSGLQGLRYTGGPLCPDCSSVLPLVKYGLTDEKTWESPTTMLQCEQTDCWMNYDAEDLLTKPIGMDIKFTCTSCS